MFGQINRHILQHWQVGMDFQFSPQIGDFSWLSDAFFVALSRKFIRSPLSWNVNNFYLDVPFQPRAVSLTPPSFQIKVSSLIENLPPSL